MNGNESTPPKTRITAALCGAGALPSLLSVDTLAAVCMGWRPQGTIEHGASIALLLLDAMLIGCLVSPRGRRWLSAWWLEAVLLSVALCLCAGLLEGGAGYLEARLRFKPDYHTRGPNLRRIFRPDPAYLPGMLAAAHFTTGPDGLRAPYPPEARHTHRILCLGGSTTECVYLDDWATWPGQLMKRLNLDKTEEDAWVGNAGISGFDTHEHARFMARSPLLQGMHRVLVQPGINDLWRCLANEEKQIRYDRFLAEPLPQSRPPAAGAGRPWRPLWTRSRLIQFYHTFRQVRYQRRATPAPRTETIEGMGGQEYRIRRDKRESARIREELPDLSRGLREYGARIREMIRQGKRRGVPVAFTTQAVLWRADLPAAVEKRCWFGWLENGEYLSIAALRTAMDAYNGALKQACKEMNVPCVDLDAMNGNPAYFYDDCHFTPAGAEEVARRIVDGIGDWLRAEAIPERPGK